MYGPTPTLPDIPHAEWQARISRAQSLMDAAAIDLLVLWAEKNVRYFSGFTSIHWSMASIQPLVVLVPASGDPVAITCEFFRSTVEAQSWIRDIRCPPNVDPHSEKVIRQFPLDIATEITELGFGSARIALEMGARGDMFIPRPLNDILTFLDALSSAELVDGDGVIWGCREIKSPLEIDRLVTAAAVHRQATAAVAQGYRPGMTEADVGKMFICAAYQAGAELVVPGNIMCGAAKEGVADTKHSFDGVTIGRGDYLELDLGVAYKGYWADMARVLNVGPVDDGFARDSELLRTAFEAVVDAARPGLSVRDLQRVFYEAGGCETPDEMAGHGIGLDIHEPPALTPDSEAVLAAGMTLEVEPFFIRGDWRWRGGGGLFHYENLMIITESGCTPVYSLDPRIIQVAHPIA
jgi:Xaa-Pro aminopeptidase